MRKKIINNCLVALLIVGSAISLLSCKEHSTVKTSVSKETLMSESSDSLTVVVSENGRPSYRFSAPLVEGYSLAREPYREFRRGVNIITYLNDSTKMEDSRLRANYAIYYSNLKLWEAKGDVVVVKHDGKELYTQQLFWKSTTERIYSNVDTKIVDTNSGDVYQGEGFESDEQMKQWSFRRMTGRMKVDTSTTPADSVATKEPVEPEQASKAPKTTKANETAKPSAGSNLNKTSSAAAKVSRSATSTPPTTPTRVTNSKSAAEDEAELQRPKQVEATSGAKVR